MLPDEPVVTWTLTKNPRLGQNGYDARSVCPHGDMGTFIFTTHDALRAAMPGLALTHAMQLGCSCPMGPITIDGVPFPFDEEGPGRVV